MPRKNYEELSLKEMLQKQQKAGISDANRKIAPSAGAEKETVLRDGAPLRSLADRVKDILGIATNPNRNKTNMLFFVMYDIESNKVRNHVAKFLIKQGCTRIQNSIFLADLSREKYDKIRANLAEVQSLYDNHDSILIIPISTDYLRSMKVIGKKLDIDIIMQSKTTLFF